MTGHKSTGVLPLKALILSGVAIIALPLFSLLAAAVDHRTTQREAAGAVTCSER